MVCWPIVLGPVARQHIMLGAYSRTKLSHRAKKEMEGSGVPQLPSEAHPQ